ncbi:4-hydroxy-tetrahydrodipicolinate synthase [Algoriphagus sp. CAU 1675]|uniref:4-hydroxy-tetrahydrodipicolinate synthase n=1 Tax=Algoriphagus sp. CAU 1675 TaxID=3032597 RepID=UPI0023D9CFCB|nr:4-hydroxy-tetrahydrodipicolinate synthase [Algoriphagus sp. CAU 1675]MDF2157274.1 4-hydroxy-tetrahydrodipicolinate synthase [Algoriphagus sp. CAU 1675]
MDLPKPFRGIIPPLITPLLADLSLDQTSLEKILEHVIAGGVDGVFILGTTGEAPSLSKQLKKELIQATGEMVNGRIPVLVGITDCSFEESLDLAEYARKAGANALVATTPFYMKIGQDELVNYFQKLADAVDLPLFLYNMPSHTHLSIAVERVKKLSQHPNIVGIKDSSGDLTYFQELCDACREMPEFTVLVGPEEILLETLQMGGHGGVTGGSNLFPDLYVSVMEAFDKNDKARASELQESIGFLSKNLYHHGGYPNDYLKGIKGAMALEGLCQKFTALPVIPFNESEMNTLSEKLDTVKAQLRNMI